jgi:hypothetical protein
MIPPLALSSVESFFLLLDKLRINVTLPTTLCQEVGVSKNQDSDLKIKSLRLSCKNQTFILMPT